MTLVEFLAFGIVMTTLLVGAAAIVSLAVSHAREVYRLRRGVLTEVSCPRYEQETMVRIGVPDGDARLHVLWCERHPGGEPRCERSCFPLLHTLRPERPAPADTEQVSV